MKSDSPFYENTIKVLKQSELFGGLEEAVIQDMLLMFRRQTWLRKSIVMQPVLFYLRKGTGSTDIN